MLPKTPLNETAPLPAKPGQRMLNVPLLVGTLVALALLAPGAYFWHRYEVAILADALLERADALEMDGNWEAAAGYLYRYLQFRSDDVDARIRLATTFDRSARDFRQKSRAVELYYHARGVAADESKPAICRRLVELLLQLERFASAETEAKELLKFNEHDRQGKRLLALALYGQVRSGAFAARPEPRAAVGTALEQALAANPGDVALSLILARILRDEPNLLSDELGNLTDAERKQRADKLIDQIVAANPRSADILLCRCRYRVQYELPGAKDDLEAALRCEPDNLMVRIAAAESARREADDAHKESYEVARGHYEHAIKIAPRDARGYVGLGEVYIAQDKVDLAVATWRRGLAITNKENVQLLSRLAEALISQGKLDEAKDALASFDRAKERFREMASQAEWVRAEMASLDRMGELLRAKWLVKNRDYGQAAPLLSWLAGGEGTSQMEATQGLQASLLLGRVYTALNQWDRAAGAYERAAALQPKMVQPLSAAAAAWAAADRMDLAVRDCEKALALEDTAEIWFALAHARLQREIKLPKQTRNWEPFHQAVNEAKNPRHKEPLSDAWRVKLLEADYAVVEEESQGEPEQGYPRAVAILREGEKQYPDSARFLQELVLIYERLKCPADADRALERLRKIPDEAATACLAQARLCLLRKHYEEARKVLRAGLETLPSDAHFSLLRELAEVSLREGHAEEAQRQLSQLHEKDPANIGLICQLAELALDVGEWQRLEECERDLRKIEGPSGFFAQYYEVRRLLAQAGGPKAPGFARAAELCAELESQRPAWPRVHVLQGLILERRGLLDQALEAYREAVRLGEQRVSVYERLVVLLYQTQRFVEADQVLAQLQEHVPFSQRLSSLEILSATREGRKEQAVESARRGVQSRPDDPMARIWLGQVLAIDGRNEEAEAELRQATKLAPQDVRTYCGLFGFCLKTKQLDRARETIRELVRNAKLSDAERAFVLAQGYEAIGDQKEAEAQYREAERLAPDSAIVQTRLAGFFLQKDVVEAEKALRRTLQLEPRASAARRTLAAILAARGGEKEWQEAVRLLEQSGVGEDTADLDQRLQALLLARRGGESNLKKARQLVEALVADAKKNVPGDYLLLAQLYEADSKLQAARQQYVALVGQANPSPTYLALYVDFLLRHDFSAEATPWLEKLETLAPDDLGTLSLRTRWLKNRGRASEIEPLVKGLVEKRLKNIGEDEQKQAELFWRVGNIYTAVDQHQTAEGSYKRLAELSPEKYEPLAMCMARQERMADAIRLCLEAAKSDPSPGPAATLTSVLLAGHPAKEDFQLAEPLLTKALEDHRENADLLFNLANIRALQQQAEAAADLYQQVLRLKPQHLLALNNLATLLSEQPDKRKEALQYVDRAIQIGGPQPGLLDTKGTILVYDGKADQALLLLETAAAAPHPDPRYPFHLAIAYHRLGQIDKARSALKTAREGNLSGQVLTPTDQKLLFELEKELPK